MHVSFLFYRCGLNLADSLDCYGRCAGPGARFIIPTPSLFSIEGSRCQNLGNCHQCDYVSDWFPVALIIPIIQMNRYRFFLSFGNPMVILIVVERVITVGFDYWMAVICARFHAIVIHFMLRCHSARVLIHRNDYVLPSRRGTELAHVGACVPLTSVSNTIDGCPESCPPETTSPVCGSDGNVYRYSHPLVIRLDFIRKWQSPPPLLLVILSYYNFKELTMVPKLFGVFFFFFDWFPSQLAASERAETHRLVFRSEIEAVTGLIHR